MPRLHSGRYVALSVSPLLDLLKNGSDTQVSFYIMTLRLHVTTPRLLLNVTTVGYYLDGEGDPPNTPCNNSGFTVRDVLNGRAGWSHEDLDQFKNWLETNPAMDGWLAEKFEAINAAIAESRVWNNPLWTGESQARPQKLM
jgi:hypothetical protein